MDQEKLRRLRERYADRGAFDGDDPVLLRAARDVQSADGRRSLPYAGVPTFMGLPYAPSAAGLDVAVIGVPMDLGVSNRVLVPAPCAASNASARITRP
jgi:guanidinopropionase